MDLEDIGTKLVDTLVGWYKDYGPGKGLHLEGGLAEYYGEDLTLTRTLNPTLNIALNLTLSPNLTLTLSPTLILTLILTRGRYRERLGRWLGRGADERESPGGAAIIQMGYDWCRGPEL